MLRHLIEIKSMAAALLITLLTGFIITMVIYFSDLHETLLNPLSDLTLMIGVLSAGFFTARSRGSRGLARGVGMGLIFFLLSFFYTLLMDSSSLTFGLIMKDLLLMSAAGAVGGTLGVSTAVD